MPQGRLTGRRRPACVPPPGVSLPTAGGPRHTMRRARIAVPKSFDYATDLPVRITDINYGRHLAAEQVLPLALEARTRFLSHLGYTLTDIEGAAPIVLDCVIIYLSQAF